MNKVLNFHEISMIREDWREDIPEMKSFDSMVKDAMSKFEELFPDEKLLLLEKGLHVNRALDGMWAKAGDLTKLRPGVLAITESNAPKAYAYVRTVVGYGMRDKIQRTRYPDVNTATLPNGVPVTFVQLKIGPVRPEDGQRAWEHCVMFNVDDYKKVLEQLSQFRDKAVEKAPRRAPEPKFQKIMSGGFWNKIMQIRKLPDGAIDFGSSNLSNAEYKKFKNLRSDGVIKFDDNGRVLVTKESLMYDVPSFTDFVAFNEFSEADRQIIRSIYERGLDELKEYWSISGQTEQKVDTLFDKYMEYYGEEINAVLDGEQMMYEMIYDGVF